MPIKRQLLSSFRWSEKRQAGQGVQARSSRLLLPRILASSKFLDITRSAFLLHSSDERLKPSNFVTEGQCAHCGLAGATWNPKVLSIVKRKSA